MPCSNQNAPVCPSRLTVHDKIMLVMRMIEQHSAAIGRRPHADQSGDRLANPACEHGCNACYMSCAIAPARLKWWEGELACLTGASTIGRA